MLWQERLRKVQGPASATEDKGLRKDNEWEINQCGQGIE